MKFLIFLLFLSCSHTHISFKEKSFSSYIKKSKENILKKNIRGKKVVEAIAPFEILSKKKCSDNKKRGIILIHGLWSTPYETRYIADLFSSECFHTRSILLQGHGTEIKDLFNVKHDDWVSLIEWNIEELKKEVDEVYLLGFSVGASLSVHTAFKREDIKGLFLFSPALALPWYRFMLPVANIFTNMMKKRREDDFYRYRSADVNGPLQIYYLNGKTKDLLKKGKLNIPTLSFMFTGDRRSLDPSKVQSFLTSNFKNLKSILYYDIEEKETLKNFGQPADFVMSSFPNQKIYGQSHLSLMIPPQDPYYGKNGVYKDCEHYKEDSEIFNLCKSDKTLHQGEVIKSNMKKGPMRRLRYNPLWDSMVKTIKLFIKKRIINNI